LLVGFLVFMIDQMNSRDTQCHQKPERAQEISVQKNPGE
jgi:hypothetical protein